MNRPVKFLCQPVIQTTVPKYDNRESCPTHGQQCGSPVGLVLGLTYFYYIGFIRANVNAILLKGCVNPDKAVYRVTLLA